MPRLQRASISAVYAEAGIQENPRNRRFRRHLAGFSCRGCRGQKARADAAAMWENRQIGGHCRRFLTPAEHPTGRDKA